MGVAQAGIVSSAADESRQVELGSASAAVTQAA